MNLKSILTSPDLYVQSFDRDEAICFEMDQSAYQRSIFLDRRIAAKNMAHERVRRSDVLAAVKGAPAQGPINYIFHIAHCGSTLLARALDLPGQNLVLREPFTLRQLGVEAANGAEDAASIEMMRVLLARRYNENGPVIVKANVPVNFMIPALMRPQADQPAIVLHYALEDYLLAILRSEMHRGWVAHVSNELKPGIEKLTGRCAADESVAVSAARLWLAQLLQFDAALGAYPNTRSLSAEDLFEQPNAVLGAAFTLFGQPQNEAALDAIVSSELFTRYSKDPRHKFDNAQRVVRRAKLKEDLADELEAGRAWALAHAGQLPKRLSKPLVGDGCDLL
ncbi:hypothetical protein [Candidatus Viadribacter manganicus]|uniref:Sulfotransferase family protein n=1 Tax=Candidatus Viadribacter manganicus TaxID=1759059 RepID=A0A1B1AK87_9PROT|nr:hypothetical protein [Candidatus Viadribacter manganicus]ANP46955.1 hypothetical protein ATE48_14025 [Candidatus Viadribacter manganicus]